MKCPHCGAFAAPSANLCPRCSRPLSGKAPQSRRDSVPSRIESIASLLYVVAFVLSFGMGALTLFILMLIFGDEVIQNSNFALIWGFMGGCIGSLILFIHLIRRWKTKASGVVRPARVDQGPAPADKKRKTAGVETGNLIYGVLLFGFGCLMLWYFNEWEQTGGERTINTILYGLYMLLGKWGVAALCWIGSGVIVVRALRS